MNTVGFHGHFDIVIKSTDGTVQHVEFDNHITDVGLDKFASYLGPSDSLLYRIQLGSGVTAATDADTALATPIPELNILGNYPDTLGLSVSRDAVNCVVTNTYTAVRNGSMSYLPGEPFNYYTVTEVGSFLWGDVLLSRQLLPTPVSIKSNDDVTITYTLKMYVVPVISGSVTVTLRDATEVILPYKMYPASFGSWTIGPFGLMTAGLYYDSRYLEPPVAMGTTTGPLTDIPGIAPYPYDTLPKTADGHHLDGSGRVVLGGGTTFSTYTAGSFTREFVTKSTTSPLAQCLKGTYGLYLQDYIYDTVNSKYYSKMYWNMIFDDSPVLKDLYAVTGVLRYTSKLTWGRYVPIEPASTYTDSTTLFITDFSGALS